MKYTKNECRSPACDRKCGKLYFISTCNENGAKRCTTFGEHTPLPQEAATSSVRLNISQSVRDYITNNCNLPPSTLCFRVSESESVSITLKQMQNMVYRIRRQTTTNVRMEVEQIAQEHLFSSIGHDFDKAFVFGIHGTAALNLGNGSDENPFFIGFTSLRLFHRLGSYQGRLVVHLDATYKLNDRGYPLLVMGFSDTAKKFHLISLAVSSHETASAYTHLCSKTSLIYQSLFGRPLLPMVVVSDGAGAIFEAVSMTWPTAEHLMCTFHLQQAFLKRFANRDKKQWAKELLNSLIYTKSQQDFDRQLVAAQNQLITDGFRVPSDYLRRTWVSSVQSKWQVFRAFPGCPRTNNALESFNRVYKTTYFANMLKSKMSACISLILRSINQISSTNMSTSMNRNHAKSWLTAAKRASNHFSIQENTVTDSSGQVFTIVNGSSCSCTNFLKDGVCYHLYAYLKIIGQLSQINVNLPNEDSLIRRGNRGRPTE